MYRDREADCWEQRAPGSSQSGTKAEEERVDRLMHEEASGEWRESALLEEGSAQWTNSPCKTSE